MWRERNWQTWGKKTPEIAHLRGRFCLNILDKVQDHNEITNIMRLPI